jgi:type II secretory pathway pseudopilin PulG
MRVVPEVDTVAASAKSVISEPTGAKSGTLSQALANRTAVRQPSAKRGKRRVNMKWRNSLAPMKLAGQQGYAMAVLLVAMAVMGVMPTVVMPVWRQTMKREREAELLFRGQQYVRAIRLFQQRSGPGMFPPSTEVLVDQRFLRKKFKDPMTGEPFLVLAGAVPTGGQTTQLRLVTLTGNNASASVSGRGSNQPAVPGAMEEPRTGTVPGGIAGVISKSPDDALMRYNGRSRYNEMEFRYMPAAAAPGGGGDGRGGDGRGGPARGGRGIDGRGQPDGRGGGTTLDNRGRGGAGRGLAIEPDGRGGRQLVPFDPARGGAPTGMPPPPVRR